MLKPHFKVAINRSSGLLVLSIDIKNTNTDKSWLGHCFLGHHFASGSEKFFKSLLKNQNYPFSV